MSTISEALKKAQKRRMENGPVPEMPAEHDAPVPRDGQDGRDPVPAPGGSNSPMTGIIVVVLGLCLVFFIVWSRWPLGGGFASSETFQMAPAPPVAPTAPVAAVTVSVATASVVVTREVPVVAVPAVSPPVKPVSPPANLPILNGVFYSEQNPVAMINGSALKEGEDIDGYKVVRILARGVILKSQEGEFELRVK